MYLVLAGTSKRLFEIQLWGNSQNIELQMKLKETGGMPLKAVHISRNINKKTICENLIIPKI